MCPTQHASMDEQPLVTVKDYRPSLHHSSSSDLPESTDDEKYDFGFVDKPCPFADVPKRSKLGRLYTTRYSDGIHSERPVVTTLQTPFKLRSWSINGPDESGDPAARFPIVYEDQYTTVRMKDTELLRTQWELLNMRPGFKARIGKISPLQKSYIKPLDPPRLVQPDPRRRRLSVSKSQVRRVSDMLNSAARFVEDPSSLSDSSEDSEDKLDFTFKSSTDSCKSSQINFCLRSSSEGSSSSEESAADEDGRKGHAMVADEACVQKWWRSQSEKDAVEEKVLTLTRRVAQLNDLTSSLERELNESRCEKKRVEEQLQALQAVSATCCAPSTSPRGAGANGDLSTDAGPKRRSSKRKCMVKEEGRLRMELMEERQRAGQMREENERLLRVILRLKGEMELEHDLKKRMEKKVASEACRRRRKRGGNVAGRRDGSRESRTRLEQWRRWMFGKNKSFKSNKSDG